MTLQELSQLKQIGKNYGIEIKEASEGQGGVFSIINEKETKLSINNIKYNEFFKPFMNNTIYDLRNLEYNWNENGAEPIIPEILNKMEKLLNYLPIQTYIFPLTTGYIQFEYEKNNGEYLEFEFISDNKIKIFKINSKTFKDEYTNIIDYDENEIIKKVNEFCNIK